ncbi:MAG: CRTAC1 family protein [Terracidiphilus sp.]|nr:CRTAC1 family protein [Terracidiphilus sp.]
MSKFSALAAALLITVVCVLSQPAAEVRFEEIASGSGLRFTLNHHPTPEKHIIETMAGGVAVFDYDGDGRPDVFFTNGAPATTLEKQHPADSNRLFHNDGHLHFTDVTVKAGLEGAGYSMGAAVADFDNDGHPDLFVAGVHHNILYHNRGDGTFEDVTLRTGIRSDHWAVAAGWFDFDNDGLLDLFVVNYMKWTPAFSLYCGDRSRGIRFYCHPDVFEGLSNTLYRNRGNGTFEDVSARTGLDKFVGRGMSVAFNDYDGDGFLDVVVTNDKLPNFLFHNVRGERFEEVGLTAGVGLPDAGRAVSSMGVDFRDYDNDGQPDIAIVALANETFPLFRNEGAGMFRDATYSSGLARASAKRSGYCPALADFNNDGYKDLFVSGGHVNDRIAETEPSRYKEPNMIFLNLGDGRFRDVSKSAGEAFATTARAHRGCAVADFDGDGRMDVLVTALGEPAELWHNTTPAGAPWVEVVLRGTKSNRSAIGAQVRVGNQVQIQSSAVGYASSSMGPVHFGGVGAGGEIEVRWPSGKRTRVPIAKLNGVQVVTEP